MKLRAYLTITLLLLIFSNCGNNNKDGVIEGSGTIESKDILISSLAAGRIESLYFDEGDQLKKGDTLAIIDHELYGLQLMQAEASRDFARAQLNLLLKGARKEDISLAEEANNQARINLELAEKEFQRMKSLFNSGSITRQQFDEVSARYEIAEAQFKSSGQNLKKIRNISRDEEIAQANASLMKAEAQVKLISKNIKDCFVTSPISGHVVKRFMEIGEVVSPMSALFKVSDLSTVELFIYINETVLGRVKTGQRAEVTGDTFRDKTYAGTVMYISSEAEFTPKSIQTKEERTKLVYGVKIRIPNPDLELKSGMPADARILTNIE